MLWALHCEYTLVVCLQTADVVTGTQSLEGVALTASRGDMRSFPCRRSTKYL